MNHDLDVLVREPEQEVRFDHLECLVGEGRTVDRDLPSHAPGRMAQCIIYCRRRESLNAPVTERAAGSSEHNATNLRRRMSSNALENRAMLAVDRDNFPRSSSARVPYEIACDYKGFLVGERNALSSFQRSKCGVEPGSTDDRVEHDIDVIAGSSSDQRVRSALPGLVCISLRFHHSHKRR